MSDNKYNKDRYRSSGGLGGGGRYNKILRQS